MHYSTVFDVFGEEYFVIKSRYSKKFNVELVYGRKEERALKPSQLILTESLKKVLLENQSRQQKDFGEYLSASTVKILRKKMMQNPYESYRQWVESADTRKPKEVRFLNPSTQPEILKDYFGVKHILFSARIANNGIILPVGTPLEDYRVGKYGRTFVLTNELVNFVKKYQHKPSWATKELGIHIDVFRKLRQEVGFDRVSYENTLLWISAHLEEVVTMSTKRFVEQYKEYLRSAAIIKNTKNGFNLMKAFRDSSDKELRKNLHILRTLDKKNISEVLKTLRQRLSPDKARVCAQAYQILLYAEKYTHPIPKELKGILKKKRLQ